MLLVEKVVASVSTEEARSKQASTEEGAVGYCEQRIESRGLVAEMGSLKTACMKEH